MLVLRFGLNPDYVLDKMEIYEINSLIKYQYFKYQEAWERSRMIAFMIAKANGSKIQKFSDLIKFQWETNKNGGNQLKTEDDIKKFEEDRKRLRAKAQEVLNNLNQINQ